MDKIVQVNKSIKKPKKFDFNIVVIGAGSAGLVTSYIAAAVKAKVALIEKQKMGGDCLNTGCVPSKALIKSAKIVHYVTRAREFGFNGGSIDFNFGLVMKRIQRVISTIEPHDSVERYSSLGVDCFQGEAKITSPYTVEVNGQTLTTRNIVIATGAGPFVPSFPGMDKVEYLTTDTIWNLRECPERLVVLGGGPIGSELAQAMSRLGSKVTIVEREDRILSKEDPDVSHMVSEKFKREGIEVLISHNALEFKKDGRHQSIVVEGPGGKKEVEFDKVLFALGRKANVKGFGIEDLGIQLSDRGTVVADSFLRTNYKNIFVCGDVTGPYQFTHTAAHQAWFAAVNALFSPFKKFKVDYSIIPWSTFTDPEVARVGLSETEAKEQGIDFEVTTYGIDDLDRAIAEEEAYGLVKVLTARGKDRILGVTIVGAHAGDTIAEFVLAMKYGIGLNKILGTIHIYPTFAEANKFAAGNWKRAHAPERILKLLEKFHSWRRS